MVALVVSLLDIVTVTPPAGAGEVRFTAKPADWLGPIETLAGSVMVPVGDTFTVMVASGIPGELARMIVVPLPIALIAMIFVDCELPSPKKNDVPCTVATAGLSEVRVASSPTI
jgi:hypothetical protein